MITRNKAKSQKNFNNSLKNKQKNTPFFKENTNQNDIKTDQKDKLSIKNINNILDNEITPQPNNRKNKKSMKSDNHYPKNRKEIQHIFMIDPKSDTMKKYPVFHDQIITSQKCNPKMSSFDFFGQKITHNQILILDNQQIMMSSDNYEQFLHQVMIPPELQNDQDYQSDQEVVKAGIKRTYKDLMNAVDDYQRTKKKQVNMKKNKIKVENQQNELISVSSNDSAKLNINGNNDKSFNKKNKSNTINKSIKNNKSNKIKLNITQQLDTHYNVFQTENKMNQQNNHINNINYQNENYQLQTDYQNGYDGDDQNYSGESKITRG